MKVSKGCKLIVLGVLLVVIDQIVKVLVKTNMTLGEVIPVFGDWFRLCFVENEGKYILTTFRIVLSVAIIWWLSKLVRKPDTPAGVLIGLTAIAAGAVGNLVDCLFYGLIWDYAPLMQGRVVDMFSATFFPPVFNFADSCVTVGAFYLILFQWKYFSSEEKKNTETK